VRFAEVPWPPELGAPALEVRLADGTVVRGASAAEVAALVRPLRGSARTNPASSSTHAPRSVVPSGILTSNPRAALGGNPTCAKRMVGTAGFGFVRVPASVPIRGSSSFCTQVQNVV